MRHAIGVLLVFSLVLAGFTAMDGARVLPDLPEPVADSDYHNDGTFPSGQVELGRLLFFDKIISGNQNIACATCHHPQFATTDGVPLGLGEGPEGLGPDRKPGNGILTAVHARVPRNSPALFNLGAKEFTRLFHDGRVETDPNGYYEGGFITPAKWKLPTGLETVLAAQAMFPVASPDEMTGQKSENSIADAVSLNNVAGRGGVWEQLAERLRANPEYVRLFRKTYPDQVRKADDITFVMAANAIGAFEAQALRADQSPFDEYLRGSKSSLSAQQVRGMELFYGEAGCSGCHSGPFQTDHEFHAIAMPQIGPGKGDGHDPDYWRATGERVFLEDFGRARVTVRPEDRFKFRTPSLRNVELTGPWGHGGAYDRLEDVVRHHLDPLESLDRYELREDYLPPMGPVVEVTAAGSRLYLSWISERRLNAFLDRDGWVHGHAALRARIAEANELAPISLTEAEVADIVAFLGSLTDPSSRNLLDVIPETVPSGLPVDR